MLNSTVPYTPSRYSSRVTASAPPPELVSVDPPARQKDWKVEMSHDITRARVIQVWFSVLGLAAAFWFAFGTALGVGTVALLVGLSVVPPAILLILWPGAQPLTAAEVIRGTGSR